MNGPLDMLGTALERGRRKVGAIFFEGMFEGLSRVSRLHPQSDPKRHGVEVLKDIPYMDDGRPEHLLDVYRPINREGPLPVVIYVHGGSFTILSKETHWVMGLAFARRGFVVFNINYRLAPENPYPAGLKDACEASIWVAEHAAEFGGDPSRLVLSGESAGANLVTSVTLASCYRFPEPWAQRVWDAELALRAVIPTCGMLQVTDPGRFARRRPLSLVIRDRIEGVTACYLGAREGRPGELPLADPLVFLEEGRTPERPLPPFFTLCGLSDPILDDTVRLQKAVEKMGVTSEARYYPGEPHAFHALVWKEHARQAWRDQFEFLGRQLP